MKISSLTVILLIKLNVLSCNFGMAKFHEACNHTRNLAVFSERMSTNNHRHRLTGLATKRGKHRQFRKVAPGKMFDRYGRNWKEMLYFNSGSLGSGDTKAAPDVFDDEIAFDWRKREDAYRLSEPWEHPYAVILVGNTVTNGETEIAVCSGTLLTLEWVLTAAHCLLDVERVWAYAGGSKVGEVFEGRDDRVPKSDGIPRYAQLLRSERIIPHPGYVYMGYPDLGLVKVEGRFNASATVNNTRLSREPWNITGYVSCVTTAFGSVSEGKKSDDDFARKTHELEIKRPCLCAFVLPLLQKSHVLCGKPVKDHGICSGDSGGGLVCGGEVRAVNMGTMYFDDIGYCELTSSPEGGDCGGPNSMDVYQDTCPSLRWVNRYVGLFQDHEIVACSDNGAVGPPRPLQGVWTVLLAGMLWLTCSSHATRYL